MTLYIRPLSVSDLDQCVTVESAAFPPAEAATREKVNTVIQLVTVVLHRHLNFAHPVACDVVFFQVLNPRNVNQESNAHLILD